MIPKLMLSGSTVPPIFKGTTAGGLNARIILRFVFNGCHNRSTGCSETRHRLEPGVLGRTIFLAAEGDLAAVTKYPEYSGFRTLPTVMDAPSSFARKQISMLVSSLFVTAIIKSARPTSASLSTLGAVALPVIVLTSN